MKKIVSFSLWGDNTLYTKGAVENARMYPEIFKDWKCLFYHDDSVPDEILKKIKEYGGELREMGKTIDVLGMYWRFHPMFDDNNIERFIVRDTDSRPTVREKEAVDEWIDSGATFHVMRDCESHGTSILGGTWGAIPGCIEHFEQRMQIWFTQLVPCGENPRGLFHGTDQMFLHKLVWPLIKDTYICHVREGMPKLKFADNDKWFPSPLGADGHYVGMVC